jgi:flagellar biosynthesis anti-sigma factor FlgM
MKINDRITNYEISKHLPQSTKSTAEQTGEKQFVDKQKTTGTEHSEQDAIVNLSSTFNEAQTVKKIIESEPEVRKDKVAELKGRIESGRYSIDHKAVAEKMVDSFLEETL